MQFALAVFNSLRDCGDDRIRWPTTSEHFEMKSSLRGFKSAIAYVEGLKSSS